MTKLSVDTDFQKGLNSKSQIAALKAKKTKAGATHSLPKWLTDALNLLVCAVVGGACTWVMMNYVL